MQHNSVWFSSTDKLIQSCVLTTISKKRGATCFRFLVEDSVGQTEASVSASSNAAGSRRWYVGIYLHLRAGTQIRLTGNFSFNKLGVLQSLIEKSDFFFLKKALLLLIMRKQRGNLGKL